MKKIICFFMIIFLTFISSVPVNADTSFAVYSNKVYYGMNFDYPDVDFVFKIDQIGDKQVFHLDFPYIDEQYVQVSGINTDGLFVSNQSVYPEQLNCFYPSDSIINIPDLTTMAIKDYSSASEVEEFIKDKRMASINTNISIHDLFADTSGNAFIVETGEESNQIIKKQNNFIVMTNFLNQDFIGKQYFEVAGTGADRYITACEYIADNTYEFTYNDGFEVLKRTIQGEEGESPTQCSMLFDPEKNEVYVVIKREFDKVWRVSIKDRTIETYSGFSKYRKLRFDYDGISWQELVKDAGASKIWMLITGITIGIIVVILEIIIYLLRKRRKVTKKIIW